MKKLAYRYLLFTCLLCVSLLSLHSPGALAEDSFASRIDGIFSEWNRADSPGCSLSVIKDGKIVYEKGYGLANLEYGIPITPKTLFHVASVSKQFTAFAILLLEREGKLSLDDDIRKYLPYVPDFGRTVTIRNLLNHTGGLRDQWDLTSIAGWADEDVITQEQIERILSRQRELNFIPGDRHLYSNSGYTLLANIVEKVSGQPFCAYTKAHIFEPLGMKSSFFRLDQDMIIRDRSYSYAKDASGIFKNSILSYANVGATSLFSSASDMALWMDNFFTGKVGGREVIKEMTTQGILNDGKKISYCCGVVADEYRGLRRINHSGADAGYRSYVGVFPEEKLGIAVLCNLGPMSPDKLAMKVAELYLGSRMKKVVEYGKGSRVKLQPGDLKKFEGKYETDSLGVFSAEVKGDKLMLNSPLIGEAELIPLSGKSFYVEGRNMPVTFKEDSTGHVIGCIINEGSESAMEASAVHTLDLTEKDLRGYEGRYYSTELETLYTVTVEKGKLTLTNIHTGTLGLDASAKDRFCDDASGMMKILFERDGTGAVTGLRWSAWRSKNILFKKCTLPEI